MVMARVGMSMYVAGDVKSRGVARYRLLATNPCPDAILVNGRGNPHSIRAAVDGYSDCGTGGMPRSPGPLEVVATEPAGDVDDFADEVETGHES